MTPRLATLLLIALMTLLAACSRAQTGSAVAPNETAAPSPLTCTTDAQCTVKNVGNCCGEYLACVHVDQPVDAAAVKRRCEAEGLSSVCGFKDIQGCRCDAGSCVESVIDSAESKQ